MSRPEYNNCEVTTKRLEALKWYARSYIELGMRVFPLWGVDQDLNCLCGDPKCDAQGGKHPMTIAPFTNGVKTATADIEALDVVFDQHPWCNIGMEVPDGMIAVDVDPRNGGDQTLDDLTARNGKFPDTWDQLTGGGGRHICYQIPLGTKFVGKLGPGIDIKQTGGYIVVEPSRHKSGSEYVWEASSNPLDGVAIAMAPDWILRIGTRPNRGEIGKSMAQFNITPDVVQELRSALQCIDADDRDLWIKMGHALKTIGDVGLDLWDEWSRRSAKYRADEIVMRWFGFKPADITYRSVFSVAQAGGWINPRSNAAKVAQMYQFPTSDTVDPETGEVLPDEAARPIFTQVSDLLADIKPVAWLIENYLEMDALSMMFGPSGGGKSFVVVDMACCIATGTPWHGMATTKGSVFYVAGEGHNGLAKRFAAWQKAYKTPIDKSVPLFKSNRAVMMLNAAAALEMSNEVEALAQATGMPPALVVIDTLARNFGDGDENTQKDAGRFIEHIDEYIRRRWNCNVMVVHHSGHDMDRARGSSAFKGAMDQELWVKGALGKIEMKVTKMKDAETPAEKAFAITQIGLDIRDDCDVEIMGAYIKIDGDPLLFKVGIRTNGSDILAKDVVTAMHKGWPGSVPMAATLGCSERTLSRIMKSMQDSSLAQTFHHGGSKRGWELSEKALDEFSKSGGMILNS